MYTSFCTSKKSSLYDTDKNHDNKIHMAVYDAPQSATGCRTLVDRIYIMISNVYILLFTARLSFIEHQEV